MEGKHATFNLVGKIAHFFATNRPLSALVLFGVLGFGLFSFLLTPKQYNPEIVRPAFAVSITYTGATPEQAVDRVVYELVEKISAVPGVDEIFSEVRDGAEIGTTVIFDVGYSATEAKVDLLSQLEEHSYLARGFITKPYVVEVNPETIPVFQAVFSSPTHSLEEVRKQVTVLSRSLTSIPEVSDVTITGGYEPSVVVEVDPTRLKDAGLTVSDLERALTTGTSRAVLPGYESDAGMVRVIFDGRTQNVADVGELFVRDAIRVRDVALVYEGAHPMRSYTLYDTKDEDPVEVVMLSVSKVEGSSAPRVTEEVRGEIDALLKEDAYRDLSYTVVSDDGVTASGEISNLSMNLMQSIAIVALVLLLFLSFRAASLVLIAIPTTLLVVFGLGYLFGETINRITLFALILSLGLLVDSSIVVVENIYVHLRRASAGVAEATRELIIAGSVNEVGIGLFLSTVTSVVVFLPVGYITGMMGPYMAPLAFFVPAALAVSLLVSIIIVPFLATYLLHADEKPTRLSAYVGRLTERGTESYRKLLGRILDSRKLQKRILIGTFGVFLASLILPFSGLVHFQMLPRADRDQFYVYVDAPTGTATSETVRIAEVLSSRITEDRDVTSVQQFIAQAPVIDFNGMFKGAQYRIGGNQATFRVNLTDADSRDRSSTDVVTDIRHELLRTYPEYAPMVRFIEEPPGPPVRATLVAKVSAPDSAVREDAVEKLFSLISDTEGVVDPYVSADDPSGSVTYTFDREQARLLGVSEQSVLSVLRLYGGGVAVSEYLGEEQVEHTPVLLALPRQFRDAPGDISLLSVQAEGGKLVPISAVLEKSYAPSAGAVYLERNEELTYITGEVEEQPIIYATLSILKSLGRGELPGYTVGKWGLFGVTLVDGSGNEVKLAWGGEWEMTLENFRDLGIAMGVALVLVYATLVAQARSFREPAFVMVTVPLGLIGILIGFLFLDRLFGIYLTATALIGFIALIGIAVNNAIIFGEYVEQAKEEGTSLREALVEAGGARLRPILLTTLTTVLGSLTIVSDPVWSGLAWSIVFGLSLSTVLTLVIYPTMLQFFSREDEEGDSITITNA
jgi:multidrug efflux pump subunit AcrB